MNEQPQDCRAPSPNIPFIFFICVASALGGFLWGFDAIVISGTISEVKTQFSLGPNLEGFFVSSGLLGAVFGSGLSGWVSDRFGRSKCLVSAALLMLLSALGSCLANNIELLIIARALGGIGVGISAMVCPLYISEISPANLRGRLVTTFQFAITIGIMVALFNNYGLHQWAQSLAQSDSLNPFVRWILVEETWRSMFASELLPGILFLALALALPESPRWLVKKGKIDHARQVLSRIFKYGSEATLIEIKEAIAVEGSNKKPFFEVFAPRYRKSLVVAMLLAAFAQFSGINVVFYYGTAMLESAGLQADGALSGMAFIGLFNMIFTIIAISFVDKLGRRKLLQFGTLGAIACLIGIGAIFNSGANNLLIAMICAFVAFFAFSLGPIKFIFASEIFPTSIRSHAMAIVILTMWLTDTLVGQFTPALRDSIGPALTFCLFAAILAPQIWLVWKHMPETAGKSLEAIEALHNRDPKQS